MKFFERDIFRFDKDLLIITCIILMPFVFYLYNFAPDTKIWNISIFVIDSGAYKEVNYYLWYLSVKLLTLSLLTLWYLTCTYRWRSVIFVPIIVELFKFFGLIISAKVGIDLENLTIIETVCYSTPYVIMLLLISKKLNYYKSYNNSVTPINKEINSQIMKVSKFDSTQYKSVKLELKIIEAERSKMDKKEYLTKLIILRDRLSITN